MRREYVFILLALGVVALTYGSWSTGLSTAVLETSQRYDFSDGSYQGWTPGRDTFVTYGEIKMLYGGSGVELSRTVDFTQATSVALSWRNKISSAYLGLYINDILVASSTTPVGSWDGTGLNISEYVAGKEAKISFKPIGGTGYVYLDDVTISAVWKSSVSLSTDISDEGYPFDEVTIPIHAVDNFGNPVANLIVQYEFQVGDWYESNTVLTDATGAATIDLEPEEPGTGTLNLFTIYGGATASKTATVDLKSYLTVSIVGDSIQYLNEPVTATIHVKESGDVAIDPERIEVEASVADIPVTGSLSKREVGVYEWTSDARQVGRLTIKATPERIGYFTKQGVGEIELKQPQVLFDHNLPENVNLGTTLSVVVKTYTPQKTLMDPSTITATMRDPFDVAQTITLSKVSSGVYGFTYNFAQEGLYYLTIDASAPKFESTVLKVTVNVSSATASPAGDVATGIFASPVTLAIVAVGILLAVWRFWRGRR